MYRFNRFASPRFASLRILSHRIYRTTPHRTTPHRAPRTAHRAPRTAHRAPRTAHRAPRTAHRAPRTAHRAPRTAHRAPRTAHRAPRTAHRAPRTAHRAPRTAHRAPYPDNTTRHAPARVLPTGPGWMAPPPDAVHCPPGLEYLTMIDNLLVQQQVELLEGSSAQTQTQKLFIWHTSTYIVIRTVIQETYGQETPRHCYALIRIGQWYTIEVPLKIPFNTIQWYLLVIRPTVFWTVYFTIENHWKYHSSNGILNGIPRGIEWYTARHLMVYHWMVFGPFNGIIMTGIPFNYEGYFFQWYFDR